MDPHTWFQVVMHKLSKPSHRGQGRLSYKVFLAALDDILQITKHS
jgi:hypothetical protein